MHGLRIIALIAWLLAGQAACCPAETGGAPFTPAEDKAGVWQFAPDPALPDVLIIGDSISIGYTRLVRAQLHGLANVFRPMSADGRKPDNCGHTQMGLTNLDRWLEGHRWRVIHFNWGLWDLCYRNPASPNHGNLDKVSGTQGVSPEIYARNLEALVLRLKTTGATLVWASTTVVPPGEPGRFAGDEIRYNRIAAEIMTRYGVRIDDLHALTAKFPPEKFRAPADVHYTPDGYTDLARQVAAAIVDALPPKPWP